MYFFSKTDRKINFKQFQDALKLMAEKKYPGDVDGLKKLEDKIMAGKGPQAGNTTVSIHFKCCCLSVAMYMFAIC